MVADDDYNLDRSFGDDFFEEALGLGLAGDIQACDKRYDEGRFVARGGMKSIDVVVDNLTDREVARASLIGSDDPVKVERFFHEARICASLEHPNIVPVYDLGYDDKGEPFFTMRLLGGQTLQRLIADGSPTEPELIEIFVKVCDAVAYAHSQGIIHRDLKPDNIQIGHFGEVQVCDWGLACRDGVKPDTVETELLDDDVVMPLTVDGMIKGTPGYMSPEQSEGVSRDLTRKTDVYALGAILYFILGRKSPCEGLGMVTAIEQTREGTLPPLGPEVPRSLKAICEKAMQVSPDDRYESAEALKADVVKYQLGYPTLAEDPSPLDGLVFFLKRNQRAATITGLFLVVFNVALIWFLINLSAEEKAARAAEQKAVASEQAAVASELHARKSAEAERKAKDEVTKAYEDLLRVTAERDAFSKDVAPRMVRLARDARFEYRFAEALHYLKRGLTIAPNDREATLLLAYVQMVYGEFSQAEQSFKKAGHGESTRHRKACRRLAAAFPSETPSSVADAITVFKIYFELEMVDEQIEEMVFSPMFEEFTTEQRRELAVELFRLENPEIVPPRFKEDSAAMQWLRMKRVTYMYRTGITEFNLAQRAEERIQFIAGPKTRIVTLPKNRPSMHLRSLQACPNLEEVRIQKNFADGSQLLELPDSVLISTY
jgi:tetratricopeptide (TPR) repeat protein